MDGQGAERRQSKRYAEQVVVQWQRQEGESEPTENWNFAFIRDISKGGLCFETGKTLKTGDLLYFKVKIHFSLWPFNCTGQVLRVRNSSTPNHFEIGVQFIHIDPKDADMIDLLAWEQEQRKNNGGKPGP